MEVVQRGEVLLELEGRVELRDVACQLGSRGISGSAGGSANNSRSTHLLQGHQRRSSSHVVGFGARVDAPLRVGIDGRLLHELSLAHCIWTEGRRLWAYLDFGGRGWAWEPR